MTKALKHIPVKEHTHRKFAIRAILANMSYDELLSQLLDSIPDTNNIPIELDGDRFK